MISDAKLLDAVNGAVAELVAEQVYRKIKADMEEQWNNILSELAYSRKMNVKLQEALDSTQLRAVKVDALIEQVQADIGKKREMQAKEDKLLNFLLKEFEVE